MGNVSGKLKVYLLKESLGSNGGAEIGPSVEMSGGKGDGKFEGSPMGESLVTYEGA